MSDSPGEKGVLKPIGPNRSDLVYQESGNQEVPDTQHLQSKVHVSRRVQLHVDANEFMCYRSGGHGVQSRRNAVILWDYQVVQRCLQVFGMFFWLGGYGVV